MTFEEGLVTEHEVIDKIKQTLEDNKGGYVPLHIVNAYSLPKKLGWYFLPRNFISDIGYKLRLDVLTILYHPEEDTLFIKHKPTLETADTPDVSLAVEQANHIIVMRYFGIMFKGDLSLLFGPERRDTLKITGVSELFEKHS